MTKESKQTLIDIISYEKSRKVLFGQWGFDSKSIKNQGTTILFYGGRGTGKSLAAEIIGFECGKPLKIVDFSEYLTNHMYTTSKNIQNLFKETKKVGAILVFKIYPDTKYKVDESTNLLFNYIERYDGIVLLLISGEGEQIGKDIKKRFRFVMEFESPNKEMRKKLWKKLIPSTVPIEENMDYDKLAEYKFNGQDIQKIIFKTCSKSALEREKNIKMESLLGECKFELEKNSENSNSFVSKTMFYN
jgi:AAA+ superfamily predicted ATPase